MINNYKIRFNIYEQATASTIPPFPYLIFYCPAMHIQLIGNHLQILPNMKDIVEEKFIQEVERHLATFNEDMKKATIKVRKRENKGEYKVNFHMWLPGKEHIFAECRASNFVSAIVDLRKKVERQIDSYKGKLNRPKESFKEAFGF